MAESELLPIDVIIPVWGEAYLQGLPRALASASSAASRIVVGDEAAKKVALASGATSVLDLEVKHPGPARVQGIENSTQPYLLFMDVDDALLPGALEKLYAEIQRHPKAVGVAGYFVRSNDQSRWPQTKHAKWAVSPLGLHALLFRNMLPMNGSLLIRRSKIPTGMPLVTQVFNEDWHGILRLRAAGPIRFLHEDIYSYSISPGSISRSALDPAVRKHSDDTLIRSAEEGLGRFSLTLRIADLFAARHRNRKSRRVRRSEALPEANGKIDYSGH